MSFSIWDICERARNGPLTEEKEFDKTLFEKAKKLVKEYDIKYNPEEILVADDSLCDDVWKAGVDLFLGVGVYCLSSERVIKIHDYELKEVVRNPALGEFTIGDGRESTKFVHRAVEDKKPLLICGGPCGTAVSEEIAPKFMQAYLQEPIDMLGSPTIASVDGTEVRANTPSEIRATMCEAIWAKQSARLAGKPGIHIQGTTTALTSQAAISAFFDPGLTKTDAMVANFLANLKTNYNILSKVAFCNDYGCFLQEGTPPTLGSVGGPEISSILAVALALEGITFAYTRGTYVAGYMIDMKYQCASRRNCLWGHSLSAMAISRNSRFLNGNGATYTMAGPCTEMAFYETAAKTIADVVSGHAMAYGVGTCSGVRMDYATPLETRMMAEINQRVAGMKRTEANIILKGILKKYEEKLGNPPEGKSFVECYDLRTIKPTNDCIQVYRNVMKELVELGVPSSD